MDPNFDIISVASIESDMSCLDHLSDESDSQGIVKNECIVLVESEKEAQASASSTYCSNLPAPTPLIEKVEPSVDPTQWRSLSSLFPLLQLLPGLKEQSGYYILDGPITDTDISLLRSHAKHIKFLSNAVEIRTEGPEPMSPREPKIAVSVYMRILLELRDVLLPSLHSLTIDAKTCAGSDALKDEFQYAYPLFLVPSLRTLQFLGMLPGLEHVIFPLLSSLSYQTPKLQRLDLRGQYEYKFSSEYIDSVIAGMTDLNHLELVDIVESIGVNFLHTIAQLPNLSTFIFQDAKGGYSGLDCEGEPTGISQGFKTLRRLTITAPFQLILHILHRIESDSLSYLRFTPVVNGQYDEKDACKRELARVQAEARAKAEAEEAHIAAEKARVIAENARASANVARINAEVFQLDVPEKSIIPVVPTVLSPKRLGGPPSKKGRAITRPSNHVVVCSIPSRPSAPRSPPSQSLIPWAEIIKCILKIICSRWPCLQEFEMSLSDTTGKDRIFELPSCYLSPLQALINLESFRLENWKADQAFKAMIRSLAPYFSKVKKLDFPLGKFISPIDLRTLQVIAESCPALLSLQVGMVISDIGKNDFMISEKNRGDTHPLQVLCVGSDPGSVADADSKFAENRTQMLKLARTLDIMFPRLKSITTHVGQASDFWDGIWDFLKLCHSVRGDERVRKLDRCKCSAKK
ncbi:hypothetical protein BDQ17DRAFT_1361027 [Cyathus striatus]|nr:hypothetical protein BDQ17DRAFT_1361027 [Cyathus striatus]